MNPAKVFSFELTLKIACTIQIAVVSICCPSPSKLHCDNTLFIDGNAIVNQVGCTGVWVTWNNHPHFNDFTLSISDGGHLKGIGSRI